MELHPEYDACGARPKRHIRPPVRYADYEVDYRGYSGERYRHQLESTHQEGNARKTTLTSPYDSPLRPQRRDAILQEMDLSYRAESQQHSQENQLAPQRLPDREFREQPRDYSTPLPSSLHPIHTQEKNRVDLDDIRYERHLLQQTQRHMASDLVELRELRSDMKQLIDAVRNLQSPTSIHTRKPELTVMSPLTHVEKEPKAEEEDDWPAPPPWPDPEMDKLIPCDPPMAHSLISRIDEVPKIKKEALSAPAHDLSVGQPQVNHSGRGALPPARPWEDTACHPSPWFKPVQLPQQSHGLPPAEPKYTTAYGGQRNELGYNLTPQQRPPGMAWTQAPPFSSPQGHNYSVPEPSYRGPRPTIRSFSSRDPSEFARLKISLENLLPHDASELFKYQVLVDHLQLEEARLIADAYLNSPTPFSDTMVALNDKFGQPHQIALRRIAAVMDSPDIRRGDFAAFEKFALQIQSLVGMLKTIGHEGEVELQCGSHVARLLSKLPPEQRAEFRRCMYHQGTQTHTLTNLSDWLKYESWCQDSEGQLAVRGAREKPVFRHEGRKSKQPTTVLHGVKDTAKRSEAPVPSSSFKGNKNKPYCPFCNEEHYLSQCTKVSRLTKDQLTEWIKSNKRCWRCARPHQAAQCNLRKLCSLCQGKHLQVLHEVNKRSPKEAVSTPAAESEGIRGTTEVLYLDRPTQGSRVLLKVVKVRIHHGDKSINTYAILDDGSERTMLLSDAAEKLGVQGTPEDLPLRTIREEVQTLHGASVSFFISSPSKPKTRYKIIGAFTSGRIGLAAHTYPMEQLRNTYKHLTGLPIQTLMNVKPLLLIGSDHPHLVTPIEPVRLGPPGGPAAIRTRLGWTLQGPASLVRHLAQPQQCLFTTVTPQMSELMKHVERLWQVDTVPFRSEKLVTRSRQDQEAISILETKTIRVEVDGILRYATPLLRRKDMPLLQATKEAVMPSLRSVERRLAKDPAKAEAYRVEMQKLINAGFVIKCEPKASDKEGCEEWHIPHHMVNHNGKNRLVFNCSYQC
ncbi:uncharacterized protein [Misgurnus anguillicaudatus]|uniref:uncharacterized protein n=1 Tax=Misgurnus anguillicaudatus TaxID=75329 RepID=UPI003CCF69E0